MMTPRLIGRTTSVVVAIIASLALLVALLALLVSASAVADKGGLCQAVGAASTELAMSPRFGQLHQVLLCSQEPPSELVATKYVVALLGPVAWVLVCLVVLVAAIAWGRGRRATVLLASAVSMLATLTLVAGFLTRWLNDQVTVRLVAHLGAPDTLDAAVATSSPWWVVPRDYFDPFLSVDWTLVALGAALLVAAVALWRARGAERDVEGLV